MDDATWLESAYDILKRFLGIARREYELLSFGQCSELVWLTNDKDSIRSLPLRMIKGHPSDFHGVADQCIPGLNALMLQAMTMPEEGNSLMISLLGVIASLRELDVNIAASTGALAQTFLLAQVKRTSDADGEKKAT